MSDLSAQNFRGERKLLKLSNLIRDPRLQGRADVEGVKKYAAEVAEAVRLGRDIEPILVVRITEPEVDAAGKKVEPGDYVADGNRRSLGFEMADRAAVPAILRVGTWKDAVDVATSANADNVALIRTPEDKRRQVEMSLRNHPDRSARWHEQHCQVGHDLVPKVWKEVEKTIPKEVLEKIRKEGRVSKTGKKQAATKKAKKKPAAGAGGQKLADWKGYEESFNFQTRFVDHLAELGGKKAIVERAHRLHKEFGKFMMEWKEELRKEAEEAIERAKAAERAEKEKAEEAKKKSSAAPLAKENESAKGKES